VKLARQLWYIFSPRERIEGLALLFGMAFGAFLEAGSIGTVAPFVAVLNAPGRVFGVPAIRTLLTALHIDDAKQLLVVFGLGVACLFVVKSVYLVFLYRWMFRYIYQKHVKLTRQVLTGYLRAPYAFHLQRNTAELIKATTETIQRFSAGFLTMVLVVTGEVLVVMALVTLLMIIEPGATFAAVLVLGIPTALLYRSMQRRLADSGRVAEQSLAVMIQWAEQAIGGIKETLVMDRAAFFIDRHGRHTQQFADSWRSFMMLSNIPRLVMDTLAVIAMVAMALVTLARGQDLRSIFPILAVFAVAALRLMPSASRIAQGLAALRFHYGATEVIDRELRATRETRLDPALPAPNRARSSALPFAQSLVLEDLSYRYPSAPRPAIDGVSLEIPRGHWVGFAGPTGAGKTTLVDLVLGLLVPAGGKISVDGHNIHDDIAAWQRNIGYVPQDVYLMDDTVRHNVAFGLAEDEIDDARVWEAVRAAQVEKVVRMLPGGLNAMVGQRGGRLSGGERQRLGLARALYHNPPLLVVDEGTANLDAKTEAAILGTLAGLRGEKTVIFIAHKLDLFSGCDRVYLLRHGRIDNSGTYHELFSTDPGFRAFAGGKPGSRESIETCVEPTPKTVEDAPQAGLELRAALVLQQHDAGNDRAQPIPEPDQQHRPVTLIVNPEPKEHKISKI
jgi:ATP-binding cassette, subfamily B, bacterial PglK